MPDIGTLVFREVLDAEGHWKTLLVFPHGQVVQTDAPTWGYALRGFDRSRGRNFLTFMANNVFGLLVV